MLSEIGHYALALALAVSVIQVMLPVWGLKSHDSALMAVATPAALGVFGLVALAFAMLTTGYLTSDFSIANVVENSHSAKPFIYKLTGVWGNHEGSMLLWTLILALFGALVALSRTSLPHRLRAGTLAAQGSVIPAVSADDIKPVSPDVASACRGPGPQPALAGPRPRHPPPPALHRLCRVLDHLCLCHRRAY